MSLWRRFYYEKFDVFADLDIVAVAFFLLIY